MRRWPAPSCARKLEIQIVGKVRGQARRKVAHQSFARNLRQHALQAISDRKLDACRRALFRRHEAIADFALRGGTAALVVAPSDDPAGHRRWIALDAGCAAKARRNRTEPDTDHSLDMLRRWITRQGNTGKA